MLLHAEQDTRNVAVPNVSFGKSMVAFGFHESAIMNDRIDFCVRAEAHAYQPWRRATLRPLAFQNGS